MERLLICNLPMQPKAKVPFRGQDSSIVTSDKAYNLPINARLEKLLEPGDVLRVVSIAKMDSSGRYKEVIEIFNEEFCELARLTGAEISFECITSEFDESIDIHNKLLIDLIETFRKDEHILVDMTYGPKDLVVILFAALPFADRFLDCQIDAIMYGKTEFVDGVPKPGILCEMASLYYLNSIHNRLNCSTIEEAKAVLKLLI